MALQIKRKETLRKAVRRIGCRRAQKALVALRKCDTLEAVHEVRKEVKQLRALLRLVRSAVKRSDYRRIMSNLRKTARSLAASRDAYVKAAAVSKLTEHSTPDLSGRAFRNLRRILAEDCRKHQQGLSKDFKKSRRLLKKSCRQFRALEIERSGWRTIGCGIKRSYRDSRRAFRVARQAETPEHIHEWRKSAKDLLYQIGFLCRVWPEQMNAVEADLEQLGDYLGDAHDFSLLVDAETAKQFARQPTQEIDALKTLANRRQQELRTKALGLGTKFFQEKPAQFCKRLRRYWKCWRQKQPATERASRE